MSKIVVTTDTNCSISKEEAERLGIKLLAMPMSIDGKEYFENVELTYEQFMEKLTNGAEVFTSQPSPAQVTDLWDDALKEADYVIHVPMDSVLSGSYQTACLLADEYDGKVKVADVKRVSLLELQAIYDILYLIEQGKEPDEIVELVNANADNNSCYVALGELEHLRKGGRISGATAVVGTLLSIKPIIRFNEGALETIGKAHGMVKGESEIINLLKNDLEGKFAGKKTHLHIAYSCSEEEAIKFRDKACAALNVKPEDFNMAALPASLTCHIGAGARGIAVTVGLD